MSATSNLITIRGTLPYRIVQSGEWLIAKCEVLKVNGQGATPEAAAEQLRNALMGFLRVSFEDGTIPEIMKSAGFRVIRLGGETVWAADSPPEEGHIYQTLKFRFDFPLSQAPEVPQEREAIPSNFLPWTLTVPGSGQPPQAP